MNISGNLAKSSLARTLNFSLSLAIAFVMTPVIVHSLGNRMYGLWVIIATFLGYYGLLDFGLSSAVNRYLSRAVGQDDHAEIRGVISTAFFLFTGIGAIALCLSVLIAIFAGYFVKNPGELGLFRVIILLLGFGVSIGFPGRVFEGLLTSYLRYDLSSYADSTRLLLSNALIYYFLSRGHGLLAMAVINVGSSLLQYCMLFIFARKTFPGFSLARRYFRPNLRRPFFSYSWKTMVAMLADILRFRIDSIVIVAFLNLGLVTYYSVGMKLCDTFSSLIVTIAGTMMPVFSQYESRADWDSLRKAFLSSTKVSTCLSVFVGTSMIFYGKPFMLRWMGPDFISSYYVMVIICIPSIIALSQHPSIGLLYGISKHHYYAIANTCEGVLNLILSIILVHYYGIYGVAIGTAIEMMIFKLLIQPVFTSRAIGLPIYQYYVETLFYTALKTLVPLLGYFYLVRNFITSDYYSIAMSGMFQTVMFVPFGYVILLNASEKRFVRKAIGLAV